MPRRMSCSMTIDAVRSRQKTVTRRHVDTWRTLKPGDRLTLIEKGMGLKKGEPQVVLAEVEVVDVRVEPLHLVDEDDVRREGFDDMEPAEFCLMWQAGHGYAHVWRQDDHMAIMCRRIEWRYLCDVPGCTTSPTAHDTTLDAWLCADHHRSVCAGQLIRVDTTHPLELAGGEA